MEDRDATAKKMFEVLRYEEIKFFAEVKPKNMKVSFIRWVMSVLREKKLGAMVKAEMPRQRQAVSFAQGSKQISVRPKIKFLCFIKTGQVPFYLKGMEEPYHKWKNGDVFGFEDYIYRMDEEKRNDLVDDQMNFSHLKFDAWWRRKFYLSRMVL